KARFSSASAASVWLFVGSIRWRVSRGIVVSVVCSDGSNAIERSCRLSVRPFTNAAPTALQPKQEARGVFSAPSRDLGNGVPTTQRFVGPQMQSFSDPQFSSNAFHGSE